MPTHRRPHLVLLLSFAVLGCAEPTAPSSVGKAEPVAQPATPAVAEELAPGEPGTVKVELSSPQGVTEQELSLGPGEEKTTTIKPTQDAPPPDKSRGERLRRVFPAHLAASCTRVSDKLVSGGSQMR